MDRSPLYRYQVQTESINTGNEWRIVGQLAQSVAAKYFFAPLYVSSCQNQVFMLSSVKTSRRASRRSFPKANVARAAGVLQSKKEYYQSKAQSCFLASKLHTDVMWSMHINILTPVIKYSVCSNNSLADLWPATSRICLALLQDVSAAARSKSNGNAVIDCFFSKHIRATLESLWCYRNTLGQIRWSLQGMVWLAKWIKTSTPRNLITLPSPCLEVTIKHFICSIAYLFFLTQHQTKIYPP